MARKAGLISGNPSREKKVGFVMATIAENEAPRHSYCEIRFNGVVGIRIETAESLGMMRELLLGPNR